MITNNPFRTFTQTDGADYAAQQLKKYNEMTEFRRKAGLAGDADENCFAAKLKRADEYLNSGESYGATDSIAIILRQMEEPQAGNPVTKEVYHNGVRVLVTKDRFYGNSITIGGSANPDWIQVNCSVGTVNIDMNDTASLMKCLDMFSPEDINAIMRKITEVKQAREALREIDEMEGKLVKEQNKEEDAEEAGEAGKSEEAVKAGGEANDGVTGHGNQFL